MLLTLLNLSNPPSVSSMVLIQFWALAYRRFSESAKGDSQGSSFTTPVFRVNCRATDINWAVRPHQFHPWGYRPRPLSHQRRASWTSFLQWDPFSRYSVLSAGRRAQSLRRELEAGGQYRGCYPRSLELPWNVLLGAENPASGLQETDSKCQETHKKINP